MNEIYLLSKDERELFFRAATDIKNMPFEIIEKDYWVVWVLERLFSLEKLKPHLTFKGGTSLSKIYGLIDRFSEDIDLSIEREFFGFGAPHDPENAPSKKKQNTIIDNLSKACSTYVQTQMLADLKDAFAAKLGVTDGWQVFLDQEDPDAQTLLFEYPSKTSKAGYIRPLVKIEKGWAKKFSRTKPLVAVVEGEIVGFAEFESNGHIDCFFCHHDWIGKGVGSALMKEILQRAKNDHIHHIFSEVSITARQFFEKNGFKVVAGHTTVRNGIERTGFKMERIV
jgi:GNAT superfamily N-acetyltransferase